MTTAIAPTAQDTIDTPPLADETGASPFAPLPLDASAAQAAEQQLAAAPLPPEPIALPTRHHVTLIERAVRTKTVELEKIAKSLQVEYPAQARVVAGDAVALKRDVLAAIEAQRELSLAGWPELTSAVSHSLRDLIETAKEKRWPVERLMEKLATRVARFGRRVAERAYHAGYAARLDTAEVMCIRECDQLTRYPEQSEEEKKRAEADEIEARAARAKQRELDGEGDDETPAVDPVGEAAIDPAEEAEVDEESLEAAIAEECDQLAGLLEDAGYVVPASDLREQSMFERLCAKEWATAHIAKLKAVQEGDEDHEGVSDVEYEARVAAVDTSDAACPTWVQDLAVNGARERLNGDAPAPAAKKKGGKKAKPAPVEG